MVRSFLGNGRKHYGTSSSRERHDRASAAPPVRARWRGHGVRAGIQRSQVEGPPAIGSRAGLRARAAEQGTRHQPKTVAKWRKRATVEHIKTGPTEPRSTVLTEAEEAMVVAFRRHTLLPLDDCLYALQPSIPHLTRSALHRCLQRHGISRLPEVDGDKPQCRKFKRYPIGPRQRFLNRWRTRRLDPRRHRRSSDRRGQALSLRGYRPHIRVRRRSTRRDSRQKDGLGVPPAHARSRALPSLHDSDR
jgi:hypothetical protein